MSGEVKQFFGTGRTLMKPKPSTGAMVSEPTRDDVDIETMLDGNYALLYSAFFPAKPYLVKIEKEDESRPIKNFTDKLNSIDPSTFKKKLYFGLEQYDELTKIPLTDKEYNTKFDNFKNTHFKSDKFVYGIMFDGLTIFERLDDLKNEKTKQIITKKDIMSSDKYKLAENVRLDELIKGHSAHETVIIDGKSVKINLLRLGFGTFLGGALDGDSRCYLL